LACRTLHHGPTANWSGGRDYDAIADIHLGQECHHWNGSAARSLGFRFIMTAHTPHCPKLQPTALIRDRFAAIGREVGRASGTTIEAKAAVFSK
jgi:hypothetical protein